MTDTRATLPTSSQSLVAFRNFIHTCKIKFVNRFIDYLQIPLGEYDKPLEKDHNIIQMDVCKEVIRRQQQGR
jgi:hypothetical protein